MKKACIVGHFDYAGHTMSGAAVKVRDISLALGKYFQPKEVFTVDIFGWRNHKIRVLLQILCSFFRCKNIILVISDTSSILMNFLATLKRLTHRKVMYVVVGGELGQTLLKHPKKLNHLRYIDKFYVETIDCKADLNKVGLKNVEIFRNFKCIEPVKRDSSTRVIQKPFAFCTFSRVVREKGIEDAMSAVHMLNQEFGKTICILDIYGPIDEGYRIEFENAIGKYPDECFYKGIINSDQSVDVLKDYYCLLFPTRYQTEGIPGTLIDAFAAGIPVICSDWRRYDQIIENGKEGLVFELGNVVDLKEKMKFAVENQNAMIQLGINCLKSFEDYRATKVIQVLIKDLSL